MNGYATYPSLDDRTVIVTGGSTGLGSEFVREFVGQGAKVGFLDIDAENGNALAAELGERAMYVPCDVRDIGAVTSSIDHIGQEFGPATVLVNNAANDTRHKVADIDVDYWDDRIAVNLRHHFFAMKAVAPAMRAAGGGSIINLGSISAHVDLTDLVGYITAKAGIEGMTRTMARELGRDRIRVNCVIPGWVMTKRQLDNWVTPEAEKHIDESQCLPDRVVPDDVARLVAWLAADDSRMCTARKWVVDGGWL